VALNRGNTTAKFIRDVLQFYGNTTNIYHLYTDNQAAEHIATQPTMNEHSRAIDTRHHAIRQDYIENSMRIGGVASSENTSDILTKNLQPHLHQKHCAALHILQPTLTQSNMNLTDDSRQSSGGEDMSHILRDMNLKNSGWSPLQIQAKKTLDTRASTMTRMTPMTSPLHGIDPFDPNLHQRYDCTATHHAAHSENPHTKSLTSLDTPWNALKHDSRRHSTIRNDAHNQIQSHFTRPTKTHIPMFSAVAYPNLPLTSRDDATAVSDRPMKLTLPSKNDEAQKHRETETVYQSANFVTDKNNTNQLKYPKNLFRGKNPILDERQKMQIAYPVAARHFSPPTPTLTKVPLTFHNPNSNPTKMPAMRRGGRLYQAPYQPYGTPSMNIHTLQASVLGNIKDITDFTIQTDIEMDSSSLMVAIRLLVKCDTALETIENGLNIALPGSKYQYYRAVFKDYEDIILDQKRILENLTDVPDETRQQALNQLDDYIPQAPPGSPPYSPSSPEYSPVYCCPQIMDDPDYASDSTSDTDTTIFDEDDDEPLIE
jgi:hypothetical protein